MIDKKKNIIEEKSFEFALMIIEVVKEIQSNRKEFYFQNN